MVKHYILSAADSTKGWCLQNVGNDQHIVIGNEMVAFDILKTDDGLYVIRFGNLCVDVWEPAYKNSDIPLRLVACSSSKNQRFFLNVTGGKNTVHIYPVSVAVPGSRVAIDMFDQTQHKLTYWSTNESLNQQWKLVPEKQYNKTKPKPKPTTTCIVPTHLNSRIEKLYAVYKKEYVFPKWALNKFQIEYCNYSKYTTIYYDESKGAPAHLETTVKTLATQREPVNITMRRYYDMDKMTEFFGWSTGYYGDHYVKNETLAPNIGIYCKTPVWREKSQNFVDVHVMNAVGYAFDDVKQPDYMYFIQGNRQHELHTLYENIFQKIYTCAEQQGLTRVVMSLVGANNFARLYEDQHGHGIRHFQQTVWAPAFLKVMTKYPHIHTVMMGSENSDGFRIDGLKDIVGTGYFPDNIKHNQPDTTLFVNAWDPWSIVGNGNAGDASLDGWMGRVSMMSLLCWPMTNEHIQYTSVQNMTGDDTISCMSWNVHYWTEQNRKNGGKQTPQIHEIINKIKTLDADILMLQECVLGDSYHLYNWGGYTGKKGAPIAEKKDFPGKLAKTHDFNFAHAEHMYVLKMQDTHYNFPVGFGNAVFVKRGPNVTIHDNITLLLNDGVPPQVYTSAISSAEEKRTAAITTFTRNGIKYAVISTHLDAFDYREEPYSVRSHQLTYLSTYVLDKYGDDHVCIIGMDANMTKSGVRQSLTKTNGWSSVLSDNQHIDHIYVRQPHAHRSTPGQCVYLNERDIHNEYPLSDHPILLSSIHTQK